MSQLLQVGGTLRADSADGQSGTISLQAVGGGINIAGNLLARGTAAGSSGGQVEALATGTVAVGSHAVIDASGQAGGGTIALGTDLQRAAEGASDTNAPRAAVVKIASGAQIKADATSKGNGGKVTLLSSQETDFAGTISTTGGTLGGNGGIVEISSDGVISLGGTVIDTAIDGQAGEILLDPATLIVTSGVSPTLSGSATHNHGTTTTTFGNTTGSTGTSYVDPSELSNLSGTIILEASKLLAVDSAITNSSADLLELTSAQDLSINASISITGALDINAAGTLDIEAPLNASTITLVDTGATNNIDINGLITGTELVINAGGTVTEGTSGGISVTALTGSVGGDALLNGALNTFSTLADFLATGTLNLADSEALTQTGTATGANVTLAADGLNLNGTISATNTLALASSAGVTQGSSGMLSAETLTSDGGTITGDASLISTANDIGTLGAFGATGTLTLANGTNLDIGGTVNAEDITIATDGTLGLDGAMTAASGGNVALAATAITVSGGTIAAPEGTISIAPYGGGTLDIGGSAAGALDLSSALLAVLDTSASVLNFGSAADYVASLIIVGGSVSLGNSLVALDSTAGISVTNAGTIDANTLDLTSSGITVSGSVNATALNISASNAINDSDGVLDVTTLTGIGTAAGNIYLSGDNSIGTLNALNAAGDIVIVNTGTMTLGGAVSAGSSLALITNGLLEGTGGSLSAATIALAPYDDGAIDLGGSSDAGLQLSAALVSALDPAAIITIGAADGFNASSILTEGSVSFANTLLSLDSTGGITMDGTLDTTLLALSAGTGISQASTSVLDASTLTGIGYVSGNILLGGTNNSIAVLNGLVANGTINVQDAAALTVNGAVSAANITLAADGLDLASPISASIVELDSGGSLSQSSALYAGTLTGSVTGDAILNNSLNSITTLADFTAGGTLNLADSSGADPDRHRDGRGCDPDRRRADPEWQCHRHRQHNRHAGPDQHGQPQPVRHALRAGRQPHRHQPHAGRAGRGQHPQPLRRQWHQPGQHRRAGRDHPHRRGQRQRRHPARRHGQ